MNTDEMLSFIGIVAQIDEATGRLEQAVPLFEEDMAGMRTAYGTNDRDTLGAMQALGQAYREAGRLDESQRLLEETVRLYRNNDVSWNPDAASAIAWLGFTLVREGKFTDAEPLLREALATFSKLSDPVWPLYIQSLLGEALTGEKNYTYAEPLLLQGYRGMKEKEYLIPGDRAKTLGEAAQRLVALYTAWGKPDEASKWRGTAASSSATGTPSN